MSKPLAIDTLLASGIPWWEGTTERSLGMRLLTWTSSLRDKGHPQLNPSPSPGGVLLGIQQQQQVYIQYYHFVQVLFDENNSKQLNLRKWRYNGMIELLCHAEGALLPWLQRSVLKPKVERCLTSLKTGATRSSTDQFILRQILGHFRLFPRK